MPETKLPLPPVKKGDKLKLRITGIGLNGEFELKYKGFKLYLKDSKARRYSITESLSVEVIELFPKFGRVKMLSR